MQTFHIPTPADQHKYLLRVYFGSTTDPLSGCINRAYRDFNRTLHGFAELAKGKGLYDQGSAVVRSFLSGLVSSPGACSDQPTFDAQHRTACVQLCDSYSTGGFADFRVGQAQKWLNMALKYVFVFGGHHLPGYTRVFELAHIPLDNIILERLRSYGVPRLTTAWSRITSYDEYMGIQNWVRSTFLGSSPLAVEFQLWQNSDGPALAE